MQIRFHGCPHFHFSIFSTFSSFWASGNQIRIARAHVAAPVVELCRWCSPSIEAAALVANLLGPSVPVTLTSPFAFTSPSNHRHFCHAPRSINRNVTNCYKRVRCLYWIEMYIIWGKLFSSFGVVRMRLRSKYPFLLSGSNIQFPTFPNGFQINNVSKWKFYHSRPGSKWKWWPAVNIKHSRRELDRKPGGHLGPAAQIGANPIQPSSSSPPQYIL